MFPGTPSGRQNCHPRKLIYEPARYQWTKRANGDKQIHGNSRNLGNRDPTNTEQTERKSMIDKGKGGNNILPSANKCAGRRNQDKL